MRNKETNFDAKVAEIENLATKGCIITSFKVSYMCQVSGQLQFSIWRKYGGGNITTSWEQVLGQNMLVGIGLNHCLIQYQYLLLILKLIHGNQQVYVHNVLFQQMLVLQLRSHGILGKDFKLKKFKIKKKQIH